MVWSDDSVSECPGCGATVAVGIMSLSATCKIDGYYYVDLPKLHAWYTSRMAYENGAGAHIQDRQEGWPDTPRTGPDMSS